MGWTKTGTLPAAVVTDAGVENQVLHGTATGAAIAAKIAAARADSSAVLTNSATPAVDTITKYDATAAARTPTLPALSGVADKAELSVQKVDSSTNTVTVTCAGSDTFDSGATSLTLRYAELRTLRVVRIGGTKFWKVVSGNSPQTSIDAQIAAKAAPKIAGEYALTDYGTVDTTGTTNSNAAWNACVAAWYAGGGGTIKLPGGTILVSTQTALPSGNPSSTGMLRQPPLKLQGVGGHYAGQKSAGAGGTRLNLTYQGAASPADLSDAKIQTFGSGLLVLRDLVFMDSSTDSSTPFFYTTGTTISADSSVAFLGAVGNTGTQVKQDAFILGGTTPFPVAPVYPATPNYGSLDAAFQGYGTSIDGVYFNRIRHAVHGRMYVNQAIINKCFIDKDCGSNLANDAPILLDGAPHATLSGVNSANVITGNYIEISNYKYGIKLKSASTNYIAGNGCEDPLGGLFAAVVRCESTNVAGTDYPSVNNTIIGNLNGGGGATMISEDALSVGKNLVFDSIGSNTSIFPGKLQIGGNLLTIPSSAVFTIADRAGVPVLTLQPGAGSGPLANFNGPVTLVGTSGLSSSAVLTIGNNSNGVDPTLVLSAPTGHANQIQLKRAGVNSWLFYDANSTSFFFRDSVNAKMHVTFSPGAGAGAGSTDINSALTVAGKATLSASTTARASLNVPHGTAPTSPSDGDIWTTSAGVFARINGVTKTVTLT